MFGQSTHHAVWAMRQCRRWLSSLSEHLDADTMPSLSLVHQRFKPRGAIKWIRVLVQSNTKRKIDARTAKKDAAHRSPVEAPEQSIDKSFLSPAWLSRCQTVMRHAIALCNGAHLRILKAFDVKVFGLATQSMAQDSRLRTVNTSELLQADCKLWGELAAMHSEGWSLDQALHEMTNVCSDMHALLQPRAKQVIVYKGGAGMGKGNGKDGKGKGAKGVIQTQLKDQQNATHAAAMANLATKHGNKTLHVLAIQPRAVHKCQVQVCAPLCHQGQVCGQKHVAHAHRYKTITTAEPSTATPPPATPGNAPEIRPWKHMSLQIRPPQKT